jgi:Aspartyl protease
MVGFLFSHSGVCMTDLMFDRRLVLGGLGLSALLPRFAFAQEAPIVAKVVVEDGRLWVSAAIGKSEPLLFVIDSGASTNYLRPEIAKRLGLTVLGGGSVGGVSGKVANTGRVEANDVLIAGVVRQKTMQFSTYDFGRGLADDAAGLFASGLLTAYDSDLSFEAGRWQIWPKGRTGEPTGQRLDGASITAMGGRGAERIYVTAMINSKPYKLMVDTGAPRGLLLFPRAGTRSGLQATPSFAPVALSGFGSRANKLARLVRASNFSLGPLQFDRPFVTLMDPNQAVGNDADGVLGLPLIALYDWSTDVGRSRVWLTRNGNSLTAERYSKIGLWVDRTATGGAIVAGVGAGSPAAKAGIAVGDAITDPPKFGDVIRRINGPAGQAYTITTQRGTATTTHNLTPANFL